MPTIKRKVEMNLPQLIEWGFKNDIREKSFIVYECVEDQRHEVHFNALGIPKFSAFIKKSNAFTVEVEEEITEDTVIPKLLTTFKKTYLKNDFGYQRVRIDEDFKMQLMLNKAEAHREKIETLHMVNDDGTHTLLWRDGRLVN